MKNMNILVFRFILKNIQLVIICSGAESYIHNNHLGFFKIKKRLYVTTAMENGQFMYINTYFIYINRYFIF